MFISPKEIFDMLLMTFVVGFIFMNTLKHPGKKQDVLDKYLNKPLFDWHDFFFAAMVTAPGIILHELGHKIVALSYGLSAEFNAAYIWLFIAVILRLFSSPFIFFVPAYVSISGNATVLERIFIAFAGPGVNLLIFLIALFIIKGKKKMKKQDIIFWSLTKNINLFLFIFNMIPIPGFDGFTFFSSIWKILGL
jgi:Zn-dependent protease